MPRYSTEKRNAKLAVNTTIIGDAGKLQIYTAPRPATPGGAITTQTKLAEFTLGSPFAPDPVDGVQSPTIPAAAVGLADGVATWAQSVKADGTFVEDMSVGTSGAEINLNTTSIQSGVDVSITSWEIDGPGGA